MTSTTATTTWPRNDEDLSNLCYELKENIETKKYMITVEVTKSLEEVHQWFGSQQNQALTEHYTRILQDIQSAKENVMVQLSQIEGELLAISKSVQELHDNDVLESSRKAELRTQLEKITHELDIYEVTKTIDLSTDIPTYVLSFALISSVVVPQDSTATLHCSNQSSLLRQLADEINDLDDKINNLDLKQLEKRLLQTITSWCDFQIQTANELCNRRKEEAANTLHRNENEFKTKKSELCEEIKQLKRDRTDLTKKGKVTYDEVQLLKHHLEEILSNFNTIQDQFVVIGKSPVQIGPHAISLIEAKPKTLLSEDHRKKINQFFGDQITVDHEWQLIYKGQKDGFTSEDFHRCCDGKGPTITLVQTMTGLLFGGYTAVSWTSDGKSKADPQAFLFTLINPYQISETKFEIEKDMVDMAVAHNKNFGPIFGNGDIAIVSSSNLDGPNPSFSRFPAAYSGSTETDSRLFGGTRTFIVNELEVYTARSKSDNQLTAAAKTIQSILSTPYVYTVPLPTDDIQYGRMAVCQQHNLILLYEGGKLKLYNDHVKVHEKELSYKKWGGIGTITWYESIKKFLILTWYRLYTLPLVTSEKGNGSTFTLGNLESVDSIKSIDALEKAKKNENRLRFITLKGNQYLFLNRGYHTIEQWSTHKWEQLRSWSKQQLNYENNSEIKLITSNRSGEHIAMNIDLGDQSWVIDFRSTDLSLTLLKRIESLMGVSFHHKLDLSNLYQEDNMSNASEWLIINDKNLLYTVGVNKKPDKPQLLETIQITEETTGSSRIYFQWFLNNQFLIMSKPCDNGSGKLYFFKAKTNGTNINKDS